MPQKLIQHSLGFSRESRMDSIMRSSKNIMFSTRTKNQQISNLLEFERKKIDNSEQLVLVQTTRSINNERDSLSKMLALRKIYQRHSFEKYDPVLHPQKRNRYCHLDARDLMKMWFKGKTVSIGKTESDTLSQAESRPMSSMFRRMRMASGRSRKMSSVSGEAGTWGNLLTETIHEEPKSDLGSLTGEENDDDLDEVVYRLDDKKLHIVPNKTVLSPESKTDVKSSVINPMNKTENSSQDKEHAGEKNVIPFITSSQVTENNSINHNTNSSTLEENHISKEQIDINENKKRDLSEDIEKHDQLNDSKKTEKTFRRSVVIDNGNVNQNKYTSGENMQIEEKQSEIIGTDNHTSTIIVCSDPVKIGVENVNTSKSTIQIDKQPSNILEHDSSFPKIKTIDQETKPITSSKTEYQLRSPKLENQLTILLEMEKSVMSATSISSNKSQTTKHLPTSNGGKTSHRAKSEKNADGASAHMNKSVVNNHAENANNKHSQLYRDKTSMSARSNNSAKKSPCVAREKSSTSIQTLSKEKTSVSRKSISRKKTSVSDRGNENIDLPLVKPRRTDSGKSVRESTAGDKSARKSKSRETSVREPTSRKDNIRNETITASGLSTMKQPNHSALPIDTNLPMTAPSILKRSNPETESGHIQNKSTNETRRSSSASTLRYDTHHIHNAATNKPVNWKGLINKLRGQNTGAIVDDRVIDAKSTRRLKRREKTFVLSRERTIFPGECKSTWQMRKFIEREVSDLMFSQSPKGKRQYQIELLKERENLRLPLFVDNTKSTSAILRDFKHISKVGRTVTAP
ncbi:putative mediator of RNA polymerase II transcription subunit 26 [Mytilus trossulus]|uniref:putative mediator of RNA polymerase II transcription subunit 26 n=1 Tax=Mytilus trossulus TaxID=6551 RepID=UPI0030058E48